jgi:hypothetical protein
VIDLPQDVWFIVAGWGVILGGMALYAATLLRRLRGARETSLRIRRQADAPAPARDRE